MGGRRSLVQTSFPASPTGGVRPTTCGSIPPSRQPTSSPSARSAGLTSAARNNSRTCNEQQAHETQRSRALGPGRPQWGHRLGPRHSAPSDCIWLLPIYSSPLRDGGYDIADFMSILPEFGNIGDFVELVEAAHERGIRVIADLVMNHTSEAHPWFQASRSDPDGPFGDFYVWSDTDDRYGEARIIFVDTEQSNWTFDQVRGQYYWHRFFSHQPDLNYENPRVQEAMIEVLRVWLDLGIDGFRLDAVPYLFEPEGPNRENLKWTHEHLKRVRAEVDRLFPDPVLLAQANQWPAAVL